MSFSGWLLVVTLFIIIITVTLGIAWYLRNNTTPAPINRYSAPLVWSPPDPSNNSNKNFCQLYQFPTATFSRNNVTTVVPGAPTLNSRALDSLTGSPNIPICLDPDQIIAQQVQHRCIAPNGVLQDSITRCLLINGGTTGLGGVETYYTSSGCFKIPPCIGQLSLVSINYQSPDQPNIFCLQTNGTGNNVTMEPCNPTNNNQLLRLTRYDPGQNPNALTPGQGQNGLITQILDRSTGLCVVPGTSQNNTTYNPSYIPNGQCSGNQVTLTGNNVILSTCTGGTFPGYVWALVPSIQYCSLPGGCTPSQTIITPPQIVYIGNLNFATFPTGGTGYSGLTGPSAIFKWLIDNNARSLYYGGSGNGLILYNLGINILDCIQKPYTAQYINLTSYNTIVNQQVCRQSGSSNCIPL